MPVKEKKADKLVIRIYDTRDHMGKAAADAAAHRIKALLSRQKTLNIVFAAAPSQNEFLASLIREEGIDWDRVNAFHMDEYIGLPAAAPQTFGNFLKDHIFSALPFGNIYYLHGDAVNSVEECRRYAALLNNHPIDIVMMGVGENCHIAFNDPHVADFEDPETVKVVSLDDACRQQQVNDGCFPAFSSVPTQALTLTIPTLMRAQSIFCMVPGKNKATAVARTLAEDIGPLYPSTILRNHPNACLFLDIDSASLIT